MGTTRLGSILATALLVLTLDVGIARADIIYQFQGVDLGGLPHAFTLTVPTFLQGTGATGATPDMEFTPGPALTCSDCDAVRYFFDAVARGFTQTPSDAFGYVSGLSTFLFYFEPGAVSTLGVHNSIILFDQTAVLTVSQTTSVPEPATVALFGLASAGLGFARRRKQ